MDILITVAFVVTCILCGFAGAAIQTAIERRW